jgi:hypothetical protein
LLAGGRLRIEGAGGITRALEFGPDDRVQLAVEALDPRELRIEQLERPELSDAQCAQHRGGRGEGVHGPSFRVGLAGLTT